MTRLTPIAARSPPPRPCANSRRRRVRTRGGRRRAREASPNAKSQGSSSCFLFQATAIYFRSRPRQRFVISRQTHGFQLDEIDQFLAALASACEVVDVRFQWRPQLNDTNDEMVLEAAVNGRADALVTRNVRDFRNAGRRFGLRVLLPGELLRELGR
ncbi:MAG: PIN domain-containing protein [Roseiarcus sp.]